MKSFLDFVVINITKINFSFIIATTKINFTIPDLMVFFESLRITLCVQYILVWNIKTISILLYMYPLKTLIKSNWCYQISNFIQFLYIKVSTRNSDVYTFGLRIPASSPLISLNFVDYDICPFSMYLMALEIEYLMYKQTLSNI